MLLRSRQADAPLRCQSQCHAQGLHRVPPAGEPNNDSPLNVSAAKLWDNQAEYRATLLRKAADQTSS